MSRFGFTGRHGHTKPDRQMGSKASLRRFYQSRFGLYGWSPSRGDLQMEKRRARKKRRQRDREVSDD